MTMKKENLCKPLPADKIFYLGMSGSHAYTVLFHVTLTQCIKPEALRKALKQTMQLYPRFQAHPVIMENMLYTVTPELKDVPLFEETNQGRHYGTEDTYGYLFYVTYLSRDIYLRVFHGISDGRGIYTFLNSLVHFYFLELGYPIPEDAQLTPAPPQPEQDICSTVLNLTENLNELARTNVETPFQIPEQFFEDTVYCSRQMEIDVALLPLLAMAKRYESSPVPVLQALIGEALREVYPVNDKTIVAYTPIDLRPVFQLESAGNASSAMYIPYKSKMDSFSLEMKSTILRTSLELQAQPGNLHQGLKYIVDTVNYLDSLSASVPLEAIAQGATEEMKKSSREVFTYLISYVGKTPVSDVISPFVESVRMVGDSYHAPLTIGAVEHKGTIRLLFSMFFDNDKVVYKIYEKLKSALPETVLLDRGTVAQDALIISELEKIN